MSYAVAALAVLGEAERAREWMSRALLVDPHNETMRYNFACDLVAQLHDADGAIEMLRSVLATATRHSLDHLKVDPDFDPLQDDPRFKSMVAAAEARLAAAGSSRPTEKS